MPSGAYSNGKTLYTPGIAQTSYATGRALYANLDALGSVHDTQTDGSGGPSDVLRTEAFGSPVTGPSSAPDALALGWGASSGYQTDADTGLTLVGNRYYDAPEGRFVSPDPAGDGDNWYEYCDNDPLDYVDPTGLDMNASCPYAPQDHAGAFEDMLAGDNGLDNPNFGASDVEEQERHRDLTTTMTTWSDGTTGFVQTAGPWSDWQGDGNFHLAQTPNGVPPDWQQIPHGKDGGMEGPTGQTRWINPAGTEGLEHHPGRPGNHGGKENTHPMVPKPNGKGWKYTNPKKTIIVSSAAALGVVATWEILKWGVAILAAPESFGGSLVIAGATP